MEISPKMNKGGGFNNHVDWSFHQKLITLEVLIRHVVGIFSQKE
jgi:hypothetical protein